MRSKFLINYKSVILVLFSVLSVTNFCFSMILTPETLEEQKKRLFKVVEQTEDVFFEDESLRSELILMIGPRVLEICNYGQENILLLVDHIFKTEQALKSEKEEKSEFILIAMLEVFRFSKTPSTEWESEVSLSEEEEELEPVYYSDGEDSVERLHSFPVFPN